MKLVIISLVLTVALWPLIAQSATSAELGARLQALEEDIRILTENEASAHENVNQTMSVAGYTDAAYVVDSRNRISPSFHMHHLSLFFKQQISQTWHFFSEIEFEHTPNFGAGDPVSVLVDCGVDTSCGTPDDTYATINTLSDAEGKIFTEALNLDFTWRTYASFRLGRFFTPAGIWSIDHYPPFVTTQERPRHIRKIFPQTTDGLMVYGIAPVFNHFVSYDFYTSNGEGNVAQTDMNNHKAVGLRLNIDLPYLNNFTIGTTFYHDVLNDGTDKRAFGTHTKIRQGDYELQAEYANALMKPEAGNSYRRQGYYMQGLYQLHKWTLGLRYDYYDSQTNLAVNEVTHTLFANYHITESIILKLEQHSVDFEDPAVEDYYKTIISIAASLGH